MADSGEVVERLSARLDEQLLSAEVRFRRVLWQRTVLIIASVAAGWGVLLTLFPIR